MTTMKSATVLMGGLALVSSNILAGCSKQPPPSEILIPDPGEFVAGWQVSGMNAPCDGNAPPPECHHIALNDFLSITRDADQNFGVALAHLTGPQATKIDVAECVTLHSGYLQAHFHPMLHEENGHEGGETEDEHWLILWLHPNQNRFNLHFKICRDEPVMSNGKLICDETGGRHEGSGHADD